MYDILRYYGLLGKIKGEDTTLKLTVGKIGLFIHIYTEIGRKGREELTRVNVQRMIDMELLKNSKVDIIKTVIENMEVEMNFEIMRIREG